jgi:hypothetical protein
MGKTNASKVLVGKPRENRHWEGTDVDGMIILKWLTNGEGVDWIDLAQDRVQWWALVKTVMNI